MKSPTTDVIYHKYPSGHFDPAEKPQAVSILPPGGVEPTLPSTAYDDAAPQAVAVPPRRPFLLQLGIQLFFNGMNAVLGVGAACCVITLVAVSVGFIPFCGLGIVLFQLTAALVMLFVHLDVALANLVAPSSPKLNVDPNIECGFSSAVRGRSFWRRLIHVSPKLLVVILYFAIPKLLVGILSFSAVGFTVVMPIESLATGGRDGTLWDLNYEENRSVYILRFVCCWVFGAICFALVPKVSVKATTWICAAPKQSSIPIPMTSPRGFEAVVVVTPRVTKTEM